MFSFCNWAKQILLIFGDYSLLWGIDKTTISQYLGMYGLMKMPVRNYFWNKTTEVESTQSTTSGGEKISGAWTDFSSLAALP